MEDDQTRRARERNSNPRRASHEGRDCQIHRRVGGTLSVESSGCRATPSLHRRDVAAAGRPSPCLLTPPSTNVASAPAKCNTDGSARNLP